VTVTVETAADAVVVTLRWPEARNALGPLEAAEVADAIEDAALRRAAALILTGEGAFCSGGDLRTFAAQLAEIPAARRQAEFQRIVDRLHPAIEHLQRMPHAVIAGVQGAVAGFGLSLVGACDLVVASDDAYFSSAYRQIGLSPDGGGTWSLPRIVGLRKALEIYLLSERFDAREAARIGLVNRVVDAASLDVTVNALARSIATGPAIALRNVKRLLRESLDRPLSQQLRAEADSFGQCAADDDFAEGIEAFFAKRPPRFR
jgi:2-(1,2-epoxy-1,2-dihydrophenyl)acetyl-CoA isomerase